jgi:hypothetical protein
MPSRTGFVGAVRRDVTDQMFIVEQVTKDFDADSNTHGPNLRKQPLADSDRHLHEPGVSGQAGVWLRSGWVEATGRA